MRALRWLLAAVLVSGGFVGLTAGPAVSLDQRLGFTADGLSTWQTEGNTWALAESGGKVFVGGRFGRLLPPDGSTASPVTRTNFAVLDAATGAPLPCDVQFTSTVETNPQIRSLNVSPDGKTLWAGGSFNRVNGLTRYNLVAIDISTCSVTPFDRQVNAMVRAIQTVGSKVYFGGDFTAVQGQVRGRVAAADVAGSGSLLPWAPVADKSVRALDLDPNNGNVVVGGDFDTVNSADSHALVVVDPVVGSVVKAYPGGFFPMTSTIQDLTHDSDSFYIAAEGTGGGVFDGRAAFNLSDYNERWRDNCLGATQALVVHKGVLYSGSHAHDCSSMKAFPDGVRQHLLAEETANPTTLLPWYPNTNDGTGSEPLGPRDMVISTVGGKPYLWVGGEFTRVNGAVQRGLTRFTDTPDTGRPTIPVASAASYEAGVVRVRWRASHDDDDETLTYSVFRNGSTTPIGTATAASSWWQHPQVSFVDSSAVPGQSYSYRISASDGTNTSSLSDPVRITAATADSPYPKRVLADGASQYWRFDESGTFAADETTMNNSGRYSGDVTRPVDPGAILDDPSDSATFGGASGYAYGERRIDPPNAFSAEVWFRTTTTRGGKLIGFGDGTTGSSGNYDRHIYMNNSGQLIFGVWTGSAATLKTSSPYNDGAWHHVVGTQGPTGMALYVDGVRVGLNGVTSAQPYAGSWHVGGDNLNAWPDRPSSDYFEGSLDEAAVYPAALTRQQVADHYSMSGRVPNLPPTPTDTYGAAVYSDSPQLYWRLGEASGSTAQDASGNDQSGSYQAGATLGADGALRDNLDKAVSLSGDSQGLVTESSATSSPAQFSAELWFKTGSTSGGKLIGFGDRQTGNSSSYDKHIYMDNTGRLTFGVYTGGFATVTSNPGYNNDIWHHVVGTQGPDGMALYVDGALVGSNPTTTNQSYTGYWRVGGDNLNAWSNRGSSDYFQGTVDEVAVYPAALSASRVQEHYDIGTPAPDTQAPTIPTGVKADVNGGNDVSVSWDASNDNRGVVDYQVHRSTDPSFEVSDTTVVGTTGSTSFADAARPAGTWYYRVTARDAVGNTSAASAAVSVVVQAPDTAAPTAPSGLTATVTAHDVGLSWLASSDDRSVKEYQVYRSTDAAFTPAADNQIGTVTELAFLDANRPAGTWYYRVTATDAAGNVSDPTAATSAAVAGDPVTVTLAAVQDAYVNESAKATNYGTSSSLASRGSPLYTSYLKFNAPAVPVGTHLAGATLRIRTTDLSTAGAAEAHNVKTAANGWTETGVTYNNRPAVGSSVVGTLAAGTLPDSVYTIDLDPVQLQSLLGGELTLAMTNSGTDALWFWSHEVLAEARRPQLTLQFSP